MTRFFIALGVLGVSLCLSSLQGAELYKADWAEFATSNITARVDQISRMRFTMLPKGSSIVDGSTTPPNPFPDLQKSLRIFCPAGEASWFRQNIRLFEGAGPKRGEFQMQFRLVKGLVKLQLGFNPVPWDPSNKGCYTADAPLYLSATFAPGKKLLIDGKAVRAGSFDVLEADQNYIFTVKWDMGATPPSCTFLVNGETVTLSSVNEFTLPIRVEGALESPNAVRISLGSGDNPEGEFFLGKISASSDER